MDWGPAWEAAQSAQRRGGIAASVTWRRDSASEQQPGGDGGGSVPSPPAQRAQRLNDAPHGRLARSRPGADDFPS